MFHTNIFLIGLIKMWLTQKFNLSGKINPMSLGHAEELQTPVEQEVCIWGDSDITYLQKMTDIDIIKLSISRSIYFSKIGTHITENAQPLDLDPFFKILKRSGRNMTSVGIETPLQYQYYLI